MTAPYADVHDSATADARPSSRLVIQRPLVYAFVGLLASIFALLTFDRYPVGAGVDDTMYLILAKSLATGQGYRSLNLPGAPPNTHFPPGYPAVLSLLWRASPSFPRNVIYFKAFNMLCFVVAAVGMVRFTLRVEIGRVWAAALSVIAAISVPSLILVALLLSETLFLCLIVLLLPFMEQFVRRTPEGQRGGWRAFAIGIAIGVCTLVRSHGIVLVPAVVIVLAFHRRWRDIAFLVMSFLLCIVPWQMWSATHAGVVPAPLLGEYDSYTAWWIRGFREMGPAMIARTLARTTREAAGMFAALFSPMRGAAPRAVTFLALASLAIAGVAGAWRRIPVTLLFLAGYLAIVAVWPYQPARFIWGVWPLILLVLIIGVHSGTQARWHPSLRAVLLVSSVWVSVGYGAYELRAIRGRWWSSIPRSAAPHISFAVEWANTRTATADVIATEDEGPVYLYTGRHTVPVRPLTTRQYLEDASPRDDAATGLVPILAAYPVSTVIVYSSAAFLMAKHLSLLSRPRLVPAATSTDGAAFAVLAP